MRKNLNYTRTILYTALILLAYPSETQSSSFNPALAVRIAYEQGLRDARFTADDIGLVRLTVNDIEELL